MPLQVLQMHKEGVTIGKMLEEPQRRMLLRRELDKKLNDGKGETHNPAAPAAAAACTSAAACAAPCMTRVASTEGQVFSICLTL